MKFHYLVVIPSTSFWYRRWKFSMICWDHRGTRDRGFLFSCFVNICHVNLNSLMNKVNNVHDLLNRFDVDLLGVSETWLTSDVPDSFVSIVGYDLVRSDNPSLIKKHGVVIYIRNEIKYLNVQCDIDNMVIVFLVDFDIYVITVFRPSSYRHGECYCYFFFDEFL